MRTCPSCEAAVSPGNRWCAKCHVNVVNQQIGRLAPPVKRWIASMLDLLIPVLAFLIFIVTGTFMGPGHGSFGSISLVVLSLIISIAFLAYVVWALFLFTEGTTPGKKILGMRVVKEDGANAGFLTMLIRETVGRLISSLVFFFGLLWILIDKDNQAWHDKLMRTYVVESVK